MLFMVCYDILNDRNRRKIQKILEGYGERVQFSLFECDISETQFRSLRGELISCSSDNGDSIRYYRICKACAGRIERIGGGTFSGDESYFIV
jgi:CRISPR-associated protein Cas2